MAGSDEQDFEGQSAGRIGARDDAPGMIGGGQSGGLIEGAPSSTPDPEDVIGSETGLAAANAAASAAASSSQMASDPTFSGSNAVIDVDTFEDIQAAARRSAQRNASDTTVSANSVVSVDDFSSIQAYGNKQRADMQAMLNDFNAAKNIDDFSGIQAATARTNAMNASGLELGSVNLAPIGINVGYKSTFNPTISFDQLNASTKAAVRAAHIQSQSEDETENTITSILGNWLSMIKTADKHIDDRTEGSGGYGNTEPGDK